MPTPVDSDFQAGQAPGHGWFSGFSSVPTADAAADAPTPKVSWRWR
jgi:hypothetical protein